MDTSSELKEKYGYGEVTEEIYPNCNKNSNVILRGFLKVKMACCSIIVTIASSVTIASMISTQCEICSRNQGTTYHKRAPRLDILGGHLQKVRLYFIFSVYFLYSFRGAMAFGITIVIYQSEAV